MRRIFIVAFALFLGVFQAHSQQVDKAKKLLDEVYNKMVAYNNIYIDFKYNLDNIAENINQETKGNVTIAKNKYVLNYLGATKIFKTNQPISNNIFKFDREKYKKDGYTISEL